MPFYVAIVGVGDIIDIILLEFWEMKFKNIWESQYFLSSISLFVFLFVILGVLDSDSHGKYEGTLNGIHGVFNVKSDGTCEVMSDYMVNGIYKGKKIICTFGLV